MFLLGYDCMDRIFSVLNFLDFLKGAFGGIGQEGEAWGSLGEEFFGEFGGFGVGGFGWGNFGFKYWEYL